MALSDSGRAAGTEFEVARVVTRIWAECLDANDLPTDEDFFVLGGDSLRARAVIVKVNEQFELELSTVVLYDEGGTIESLASLVFRLISN